MTEKPFIILDFSSLKNKNFLFQNYLDILTFRKGDDINEFFYKIDRYLEQGFWASGFFHYEFGYFLEKTLISLQHNIKKKDIIAWIGISKKPETLKNKKEILQKYKENHYYLTPQNYNLQFCEYEQQINKIQKYLSQGDTYQINYTLKQKLLFDGNPYKLYLKLKACQSTHYSAFIQTEKQSILSISPELFFKVSNNNVFCRPMKGTITRSSDPNLDKTNKQILFTSEKNRAENLMIVDLIRNDLGKIAQNVKVSDLFKIETYQTLHQMTSTIKAKLNKNISSREIFNALFPCGSITGAPKIKTMKLIRNLESSNREIYTGAIGYISPQREYCFNVPIRTLSITDNQASLGIGGGIVFDSTAKDEFEEAKLKGKFLSKAITNFSLLETIKWQKDKGYILLCYHLKRLQNSLSFFHINFSITTLKSKLNSLAKSFTNQEQIIRVIISKKGKLRIEIKPYKKTKNKIIPVIISKIKVNRQNPFLFHKTTLRGVYDNERKNIEKNNIYEAIFRNESNEITEGTITNVFIKKNNFLYTPQKKCGLLPGVLRQDLLEKQLVIEKVLYEKDLINADQIYIGNSVRGLLEAKLINDS